MPGLRVVTTAHKVKLDNSRPMQFASKVDAQQYADYHFHNQAHEILKVTI